MSTNQLVSEITRRLAARGVHVEVHHAVTTSSVYLRFDHGVLKQARVGDHRGKGYAYKFEIGSHVKTCQEQQREYMGRTFTIYRYPPAHIGDLVMQVLSMRASMRGKYGREMYEEYVEQAAQRALQK